MNALVDLLASFKGSETRAKHARISGILHILLQLLLLTQLPSRDILIFTLIFREERAMDD